MDSLQKTLAKMEKENSSPSLTDIRQNFGEKTTFGFRNLPYYVKKIKQEEGKYIDGCGLYKILINPKEFIKINRDDFEEILKKVFSNCNTNIQLNDVYVESLKNHNISSDWFLKVELAGTLRDGKRFHVEFCPPRSFFSDLLLDYNHTSGSYQILIEGDHQDERIYTKIEDGRINYASLNRIPYSKPIPEDLHKYIHNTFSDIRWQLDSEVPGVLDFIRCAPKLITYWGDTKTVDDRTKSLSKLKQKIRSSSK